MHKSLLLFILSAVIIFIITGCQLQKVPFTEAVINVSLPDEALQGGYDGYTVKMTNIATGRSTKATTDATGKVSITVEEGIYNVEITSVKTLTTVVSDGNTQQTYTQTVNMTGLLEKVDVLGDRIEETVPVYLSQQGNGFVIKEIYYEGSTTPANGSYYQDQFFEIYNNSDTVLYADGLTVAETSHINANAINEFADNYPNDLICQALYTVPGDGKTYPVQPGKSIIIASLAINHKAVNTNSPVDMSTADFEWYDAGKDVDVPEVPNMIRAFCYSNTIWILHVKGNHSYVIFKPAGNISDFVKENSVNVITNSGSSVTRVKVANSLIMDGVELGTAGIIGSKSLSPSIDISFTYCNASYQGKSVRRKVLKWVDGRAILQDTNNSANDFIPNTDPKPRVVE